MAIALFVSLASLGCVTLPVNVVNNCPGKLDGSMSVIAPDDDDYDFVWKKENKVVGYGNTLRDITAGYYKVEIKRVINVYVDGGQLNNPPYKFYSDSDGNNEMNVQIDDTKVYKFRRLQSATTHPFAIFSQDGVVLSGSTGELVGDGVLTMRLEETLSPIQYYCTLHTQDMIDQFEQIFSICEDPSIDVRMIESDGSRCANEGDANEGDTNNDAVCGTGCIVGSIAGGIVVFVLLCAGGYYGYKRIASTPRMQSVPPVTNQSIRPKTLVNEKSVKFARKGPPV